MNTTDMTGPEVRQWLRERHIPAGKLAAASGIALQDIYTFLAGYHGYGALRQARIDAALQLLERESEQRAAHT